MSHFTHGMYGVWKFVMCDNHGPKIRLSKKFTHSHTLLFGNYTLNNNAWTTTKATTLPQAVLKNCVFCCGSSIFVV